MRLPKTNVPGAKSCVYFKIKIILALAATVAAKQTFKIEKKPALRRSPPLLDDGNDMGGLVA